MNAYIYKSALLCEDCGLAATEERCSDPRPLNMDDSEDFPQGPFSNGGGEADCPQHCDSCNLFLENPLTSDGNEYVREQIANSSLGSIALTVWASFYALPDQQEANHA
jgi:hypothetical protein